MTTVAILGGGIGGITAAITLLRNGFDVRVFERSPSCSGNGTGFLLLDNGVRTLEALGLMAVLDIGHALSRCELTDRHGDPLQAIDLEAFGFYHPRFVEALVGALPVDCIRWGAQVTGLATTPDGTITHATLASGERVEADLYIACDGNRSACRNSLLPESQLGVDDVHELVCRLEAPDIVEALGGRFMKFHDVSRPLSVGLAPCNGRDLVWFIQASRELLYPRSTVHTVRQALARELLAGWAPLVSELVERSDFSRSYHWRTADLDPLPTLAWDNAVLLGDAGHPMLTFTSQGVASALTDALVLGECLAGAPRTRAGLSEALRNYSDRRLPEVTRIQQDGRRLRDNFLDRRLRAAPIDVPLSLLRD